MNANGAPMRWGRMRAAIVSLVALHVALLAGCNAPPEAPSTAMDAAVDSGVAPTCKGTVSWLPPDAVPDRPLMPVLMPC